TARTLDVAEIGPRLADAARIGLGARWAQVLVYDPTGGPGVVLGSSGDVVGPPTLTAPLTRGTLDAGWIECGPRADGAFRGRDRELLVTLCGHAALAIQDACLLSWLAGRLGAGGWRAPVGRGGRSPHPGPGSFRRRRRSGDGSSATCTTGSSSNLSPLSPGCGWRATESNRIREAQTPPSSKSSARHSRPRRTCGSWPEASILRSSSTPDWFRPWRRRSHASRCESRSKPTRLPPAGTVQRSRARPTLSSVRPSSMS